MTGSRRLDSRPNLTSGTCCRVATPVRAHPHFRQEVASAATPLLRRRNSSPPDRLTRLSQASLRINESLDFDTVLQDVVDSARALTASRYGAITVLGESGSCLTSSSPA